MAQVINQFYFETPNRPGVLAEIAQAMGKNHINILHMSTRGEGKRGWVYVSTSNDWRAASILRDLGYQPKGESVIAFKVANRAGRLAPFLRKLADAHINVTSLFFTSGPAGNVTVLLDSNNNRRAASLLGIREIKVFKPRQAPLALAA